MPRTLVVACGALVRELRVVLSQLGVADETVVEYLPANLHNRPEQIPGRVRDLIDEHGGVDQIVVGYADCGTGGLLDAALAGTGARRLPGSHCYEFFAGEAVFAQLHEEELGTFYLTDFLAKHFEALVWQGLGLDRHPQLLPMYFGNYRRVVLLSQTHDPDVESAGRAAAVQLGLEFEHVHVGIVPFAEAVEVRLGLSART
jgi:Protein of unknown function (DUF1638)